MIKDKSILIKNIYYMLSYAFVSLNQNGYEEMEKEEFDNIYNLFAAILLKGIGRQIKQGLHREYIGCRGNIPTVRGKIDMPGTIKEIIARRRVLTCEFDELSENNLLNQIIKTTVILLLRQNQVEANKKAELKKEMLFFSGVDIIDPSAIRWSSIHFQKNNNTYRMLIGLCQLVLEGMLLTTNKGGYRLASFIKPEQMSHLYERFILEYYVREHPKINANASQISWAVDDGYRMALPTMRSDITLTNKAGDRVLIIDAKYYTNTMQSYYNTYTIHSEHLYQIFAYVKNKEASFGSEPHKVSGMILYARTEEEIQPDNTYQMSGNQINVRTLDLNKEFSEIAAQLDKIILEYFGNNDNILNK